MGTTPQSMQAKRALIVDDSRSARVILGRMLETHGLYVDTVESAEQGLEYLRTSIPDVVFMDHLMPGMDGFEAVRAMKANAQTAAIPVIMYTSQEGAGYLHEAQRIGAMGVLSKTLKPSDVARALYELNLLPDRRDLRAMQAAAANADRSTSPSAMQQPTPPLASTQSASFRAAMEKSQERTAQDVPRPTVLTPEMRAAVTALVDEQQHELHQLLQSGLDAMGNRISAEVRTSAMQVTAAAAPPPADTHRGWLAAALLLVALVPTGVIAALYWRTLNDNQAQLEQSTSRLAMVVTDQQTQIEQLRAELRRRQMSSGETPAGPYSESLVVPYGEPPLSGARVQQVQAMLDRLTAENFHGKLNVAVYVGDFCLTGNAIKGYVIAHDQLPIRRCDLIGNPFDDSAPANQLMNAVANAATNAKVRVEIQASTRKPAVPYPPQTEKLTAGEWNRTAARNNRVDLTAVADEP
jgi:CheY-like chemotaxis protein